LTSSSFFYHSQIKKVQAKGWNAPPRPSGFSELERTYIAIAISFGVVATILLLAVVVVSQYKTNRLAFK